MKSKSLTLFTAMIVFVALATPVSLGAQDIQNSHHAKFITFDAPGAGSTTGLSYWGNPQGTYASFINPAGVIVGAYADKNWLYHGFVRYPDGSFKKIDVPGAAKVAPVSTYYGTIVFGINLNGTIVGQYEDASSFFHGFVSDPPYTKFTSIDIPGAGNSRLQGGTNVDCINDFGTTAGFVGNNDGFLFSYIRNPDGTFRTFEAGPGTGTSSFQGTWLQQFGSGCINDFGTITGLYVDPSDVGHGFVRYLNGTITTFDPPGATWTWANAINLGGAIVGGYSDASGVSHSFVRYLNGTITAFDPPGAAQGSGANGINLWGVIVGGYTDNNGASHGYVRHPDGSFMKIDAPGAGTASGQGTNPLSINLQGEITGIYTDANGVYHGFLLNP